MTPSFKKVIVLLSSGLDSAVALSMVLKTRKVAFALTFDYGQRAAAKEIERAKKLAQHFGVMHRTLVLPWFKEFKSSALLSEKTLPSPTQKNLSDLNESRKRAKAVWVPNRNGVFIEIAAGFADEDAISEIIVGFNKEEAATFPDNSVEYLSAMTKALSYSTAKHVSVMSPTAFLNKIEIVKYAKNEVFPFELIWSCYDNKEKMCGVCESCMRLKRALRANEVDDGKMFENDRFH